MIKQLMKVFLLALLSLNIIASGVIISIEGIDEKNVPLTDTKVYIEPQNGTANVGDFYTISVKIANVTNLYGFDIQLRWGTAVLKYVNHTVTTPVETYPNGILHSVVFPIKDEVDETASIPGAADGTTCWIAYLSIPPAPSFNGTGTVVNMTFQVLRNGECDIYFTKVDLSTRGATSIPHILEDGYFYRSGLGKVPVADFTFWPNPAVANKTTQFDASASYDQDLSGNIALYIWNFGDGTIENTTSPTITHTYTSLPTAGYYLVELTVLDDQGGGSQSKPKHLLVTVVHPRPVAVFNVWPEDLVAVVNKFVVCNASASYDPDPGGNITDYEWVFGDGNTTTTSSPIITHKYVAVGTYSINLTVKDDSDGLWSKRASEIIEVVERRDIEVTSVTAAPSEVIQGESVTINVTVANKGQADESFNITAYYNTTATNWVKIDQLSTSSFPKQYVPRWEFTHITNANNTVNRVLKDWVSGGSTDNRDTKVRIGTNLGFWTINPGELNNTPNSSTLVTETPLPTGGWIYSSGGIPYDARPINGQFSAGNWSFQLELYTTEGNVNATIWVRILKSDNPNPQASNANITILKNWAALFPAKRLPNTTASIFTGNVSVPAATFSNEYLYFEFQLEVTENFGGSSNTDVVFQLGGVTGTEKPRITGTTFSTQNQYTLYWDTEFASPGNHVILINVTGVPQETNITNNIAYSDSILVTERPSGIPPLDVAADVGSIHFRGEIANFYVLVSSSGKRVNASITASIIFNHAISEFSPTEIEAITTGIYLIQYQIPINASTGTYVLVVDAQRFIEEVNVTQQGTAFKSFLISSTFTGWNAMFTDWNATFNGWNAMLTEIKGDTATILTGIGEIKANLTTINATLSGLITTSKDEILAKIDTTLGPVVTKLDNINATVTRVEGNTLTINSTLGDTQSSLGTVQLTITIGLAAAAIFSAIAAIAAVLILLRKR